MYLARSDIVQAVVFRQKRLERVTVDIEMQDQVDGTEASNTAEAVGFVIPTIPQPLEKPTLASLMDLYPIMHEIARGLHANDIRNLLYVSKALYVTLSSTGASSLFGTTLSNYRSNEEAASRDATIKTFLSQGVCNDTSRASCWACGILTCKSCGTWAQKREPTLQHHIDHCRPYCGKCYFQIACFPKWKPTHSEWIVSSKEWCRLCESCSEFELYERIAERIRKRRKKRLLAVLQDVPKTCTRCEKVLNSRRLGWWVCTTCDAVCFDSCHNKRCR